MYRLVCAIWIGALAFVSSSARAEDFTILDNFNRSDGAVGRDWSEIKAVSAQPGLTIFSQKLSLRVVDQNAAIFRPLSIGSSDAVTVAATLTPLNGSFSDRINYGTRFQIHSDGSWHNGYGFDVFRVGSDSSVKLLLNGSIAASLPSTFAFAGVIHVQATIFSDGSIDGIVFDKTHLFPFSFPVHDLTGFPGNNILITQQGSESRGSVIRYPTIDNLRISVGAP